MEKEIKIEQIKRERGEKKAEAPEAEIESKEEWVEIGGQSIKSQKSKGLPLLETKLEQGSARIRDDIERKKKVEKLLEEGLSDIFISLPPNKKKEFKEEGEKTVSKIFELLNKSKTKAGKIVLLIKKWLSIIPGVNKFFLEQEAKIKADKILEMKENEEI